MDVKALSASRVKLWQTCKYQYGCRYHSFHPEVKIEQPEYFKLGSAVHAALEYAGNLVMQNNLKKFSKDDIVAITSSYFKAAAEQGLSDPGFLNDGLTLVLHKVNNFEFGYPIISLEKWFKETINGVPLVGAMDRVVEKTKRNLCVIDYKTSRSALTDEELAVDMQVGIYDLVARKQYPEYGRYTICLDYLRLFPKQVTIPKKQRKALKIQLAIIYEDILKANPDDLKPSVHQFCPWCDYVSVCPAIKEIEAELSDKDISFAEMSYEQVADTYNKSKLLAKIYDDIKAKAYAKLVRFIKDGVLEEAKTNGKSKHMQYNCGDYVVSMRQNAYVSYDVDAAYDLLGADRLVKCVDLNKTKFEKEAKAAGLTNEELDKIRTINFSKPIVDVKPIKQ